MIESSETATEYRLQRLVAYVVFSQFHSLFRPLFFVSVAADFYKPARQFSLPPPEFFLHKRRLCIVHCRHGRPQEKIQEGQSVRIAIAEQGSEDKISVIPKLCDYNRCKFRSCCFVFLKKDPTHEMMELKILSVFPNHYD